MITEKIKRERG